jgi:hypothetical protein
MALSAMTASPRRRPASRLNAREAWIIKEVTELRIVPQDLWDAVKAGKLR